MHQSMSASSNMENLSPMVIRQVAKEVSDLKNNPLEGIRVHVNDEDISDIQASIEGPADTPYAGGIFRVKLVLSKDFPLSPPKGLFVTKLFHPNVAKNGEICVNVLKKDWKPEFGIRNVLLTIRCLLIVPNPESALNEEAGKLLLDHYDDYVQRAKMMTEIHAQSTKSSKSEGAASVLATRDGPVAKKLAGEKNVLGEKNGADKKKSTKDKKRSLKRL